MTIYKLQRSQYLQDNILKTRYHITLPKPIIEEALRWIRGFPLNVDFYPAGEHFKKDKPHLVIWQPDSVWRNDR